MKVIKSDPAVVRLMTGYGVGEPRALARTDIIETLIERRNAKRAEMLSSASADAPEVPDLGINNENQLAERARKKRSRRLDAVLPDVVCIDGPSFEEVEGRSINILLQKPDQPLWLEVKPETIDYIREYATAQIASGSVKQPAPGEHREAESKVEAPCSNVIWAVDRKSYRARYKDEDGNRHTKDFKQASLAEAFMRGASSQQDDGVPVLQDVGAAELGDGVLQDTF